MGRGLSRCTRPPTSLAAGAELLLCARRVAIPGRDPSPSGCRAARRHRLAIAFVNAVGAQDELIFDGGSFALSAEGEVLVRLPRFAEEVATVDLDETAGPTSSGDERETDAEAELFAALSFGVRGFVEGNGVSSVVLGLSGGVDSALVAAIAVEALGPEKVVAIHVPSRFTDPRSTEAAREIASSLRIRFEVRPLEPLLAPFEAELADLLDAGPAGRRTHENLQARLRMTILAAFVNRHGGLLLNASNKTELALGYGTLWGDLAGLLAPIGDLPKTDVCRLSRWVARDPRDDPAVRPRAPADGGALGRAGRPVRLRRRGAARGSDRRKPRRRLRDERAAACGDPPRGREAGRSRHRPESLRVGLRERAARPGDALILNVRAPRGGPRSRPRESAMKAMLLDAPGRPLRAADVPDPVPGPGQVLLRVSACAVCRTDLHVIDGELTKPKLPLVLGHEIVGVVEACGRRVSGSPRATASACRGSARPAADAGTAPRGARTSATRPGSPDTTWTAASRNYAVADERFCFPLPAAFSDVEAAPLLCAGLIGYRTLRMAGDPRTVGIWGFGAAAHLVAQVARFEGREVFAFTRPGDASSQEFARSLGAVWAGGSDEAPPEPLDAALVFAPVGALVPAALRPFGRGASSSAAASTCPTSPRSPTSSSGGRGSSARSRT